MVQRVLAAMRLGVGVLTFSAVSASTLHAQPQPAAMKAIEDTARMKLAPLKWLVGEWTGPANITSGPRSFSVTQHEKVVLGANGTVMLIQGQGQMDGKTVFEAAGLLSFDMATHQYKWISSGGDGYLGIGEAQVKGDTLIWFTPGGGGSRTRYTIWRTAKGEWRETGEVTRDNQTWTRTFEMTLVTK